MARDQVKVGQQKSSTVREAPLACCDETAAVEFLERRRWGDMPHCPECASVDVYQMKDRKTGGRNKDYRWRCRDCGKLYTVRTGTVMGDSRIPLRYWVFALWHACSAKKGISAKQIQRQTGLSYKSALFLMHRIRWAMSPSGGQGKLTGIVEADETYVGGKPRNKMDREFRKANPQVPTNAQTMKDRKTPVFAAVERGGEVRTMVLPEVTHATLRDAVKRHVDLSSRLMTDEHAGYIMVGREFEKGHESVPHKSGVYVRGDVTTNTIEGFFSILKRGINGVYHNVSRKHLQRYLDEFEYRYNTRKLDDGERMDRLVRKCVGKKLAQYGQ